MKVTITFEDDPISGEPTGHVDFDPPYYKGQEPTPAQVLGMWVLKQLEAHGAELEVDDGA